MRLQTSREFDFALTGAEQAASGYDTAIRQAQERVAELIANADRTPIPR